MLESVYRLEFDSSNFKVDWADVGADEAAGLRILKEERDRWVSEQKQSPEQEKQ